MKAGLFGVPWLVWGLLALLVALVFVFVWPENKVNANLPAWRYIVLRWFHALVWGLLALSCFLRGILEPGKDGVANLVAAGALVIYIAFMFTLITS